jgi:hypothetical protein
MTNTLSSTIPSRPVCECGSPACRIQIDLTWKEWEDVTGDSLFVVHPNHEYSDIQACLGLGRVVARTGRYVIYKTERGTEPLCQTERE